MNLTENLASQKKQFKLWKSWSESQLEERKVFKNELFFLFFLKLQQKMLHMKLF